MNKLDLLKKIFKSMKQLITKYILRVFFRKQTWLPKQKGQEG